MKTNYDVKGFKNFEAVCVKHYAKIREIEKEIETCYDYEAKENLREMKKKMEIEFENVNLISGSGFWKAYHMIRAFQYDETTTLEFKDFLWESEVDSFCEALERFSVARFAITNTSTALMENIHWFIAKGYKMDAIEIERKNIWDEPEFVFGLAFEK